MKKTFKLYSHDNYEHSETVDMLKDQGFTDEDAEEIACQRLLYEVIFEFEYDTETQNIRLIRTNL